MTVERFARRVAVSLVVGGLLVFIPAIFSWAAAQDALDSATRSVEMLGGWVFAVFGAVMLGMGLAIAAAVSSEPASESA